MKNLKTVKFIVTAGLALAIGLFASRAGAREVPFGPQSVISTAADYAYSVYAADVDGDGDFDVLSASSLDDKIAWYENDGASPPGWTERVISTAANGAHSVYAADVDGDGDMDVLSASVNDDKIAWYENDGASPPGWTTRTISTGANGAQSVYAADMDKDGDMDVLSASYDDDKIAWYENDGASPPVWTEHVISMVADGALSVYAADVDGDGDLDALSASRFDNKIAWHENDGSWPPAWTERTISTAVLSVRSVVYAADVDGDGDIDVLLASSNDDKIAWYENETIHRSAVFPDRRIISTEAYGARSVYAADVDGDGDLDAVSANYSGDEIVWYENDGAASPSWIARTISANADGACSVYAVDVDGDGDLDVLSASSSDDKIAWYENDGASPPVWTAHDISTSAQFTRSVYAADVDGDGDMDVLSADYWDDEINWYESDGASPPVWTAYNISNTELSPYSVYAADIDGDGDMDALSAAYDDNDITWYQNWGGNPVTWTVYTIDNDCYNASSVSAADFDRDGNIDVLSACDDDVFWYESNGAYPPGWTERQINTENLDYAESVYAADVDGDGDLDVLSASYGDDKIAWYENDGASPPVWTAHTISTAADGAYSVYAADVDGDGDMDVLSASGNDDMIAWYENRGGQFALGTGSVMTNPVNEGALNELLQIVATHRGRTGDTDFELVTFEFRFEEAPGDPLTSAEANSLIDILYVYRDDGDGVFEEDQDTLVTTVSDLSLTNGFQTVIFLDGDPYVQVVFGTPRTYFVVALFTETAGDQTPSTFQVIHHTRSSSTAEDRDHDIPLTLEYVENATATVTAYNLGPSDILITNSTISEDASPATLIGYLSCTDPEGDFPCSLEPHFGSEPFTLIGNALILAGALNYENKSSYLLPILAEDSKGARSRLSLTITVINVNEAPVANSDTATVNEGGTVTILDSLDASVADNDSDPEAGILTVDTTPVIAPMNGLLTLNADGTFSYTHNGGETTSDSFEYEVCDDGAPALCDTAVVSITVTPVNDAPDAVNDSATVAEGGTVSILNSGQASLLANDTDPDGTLILYSTPVTAPANGTVMLYPSGAFTYTHDGLETTTDSFNYKVCDNGAPARCDYAQMTITITPVNDAPVAAADSISVAEGGTKTTLVGGAADLRWNDSDVDGTITVSTTPVVFPVNGAVTLYSNGTFSYTHNGGETLSDSFTYKICDNGAPSLCATAQVSITITPVNDPPVVVADSATAAEGGMASILGTGQASLLANDTDPDSTLTVNTTAVVAPVNGTVTLYASGAFLYVHNGSETTTDSFTYRACDSGPLCANAVVSITVLPVNDAPTAAADGITVAEGGTATTLTPSGTSLITNDADPDGTLVLTTTPVNGPFSGTLTLNAGGTFSYTHNGSETLNDSFTYEICDNGTPKLCATTTVRISITPVNDPPVPVGDFITVNEGGTITTLAGGGTSLLANDSDPDSASLTVKAAPVSGPYHGTLILYSGGTFSYVHDGSDTLGDSFTYQACDNGTPALCASTTVNITVIPVDDTPVDTTPAAQLLEFDDLTPRGTISGMEGTSISFTVEMAGSVSGITYEIQGLPEGASFDVSTGVFTWTPTMSDYGEWLITITATDGKSLISRDISIFVDYLDADGDYLPDTWEVSVGLNPASPDSDNDGIDDYEEAGPGALPLDTDADGTPDALDDDSDGDGVSDADEAGDADLATAPWDTDGDGIPDYRDLDSDNDGVADVSDNCRLVVNVNQADKNKDGVGDVCDADFKPNYGGGGCGCAVGPNHPGDPLGFLMFVGLLGCWVVRGKMRRRWLGCLVV